MANILQNPSYKANLGYSGFDMSQKLKFSSTVGELLPIYFDLLQPGDKVTVSTELKTRTMPLDAAAMTTISEHIDWYFVPLEQLYSPFGSLFFGINDLRSSLIDKNNLLNQIPFFDAENFSEGIDGIVCPYNDAAHVTNYKKDMFGLYNTSLRLFEMLGISADNLYSYRYNRVADGEDSDVTLTLPLMPFYFAAYQKIYWDCFALKDRQECNPKYWSLDKYFSSTSIPAADLWNFVELRYRPFERDFFTNSFVSPLFMSGSINSLDGHVNDGSTGLEHAFKQWLVDFNPVGIQPDGSLAQEAENVTSISQPDGIGNVGRQTLRTIASPTAIRTSFAVQKLLEVTRRAGKHVDAQQLAHFGVKMPTGISGEVVRLGSSLNSNVRIGDVIATATTDDSVLGQVGGKGYGYGKGDTIKFIASSHGIIMGIYSASVERHYKNAYDRLHSYIYMADFPHPELDNLGQQPLFNYQSIWPSDTSFTDSSEVVAFENWQYRWSELKCKYNRSVGALAASLNYWTTNSIFNGESLAYGFMQSPFALNSIMLVPYTTSPSYSESAKYDGLWMQDPLIHELYIDCKKASKMSTYGLEQL